MWSRGFYYTPEWRALRVRYFKKHPKACVVCRSTKVVELHHLTYERFGGGEWLSDLVALCPKHHAGAHKAYKIAMKKGLNLREATRVYIRLTRIKSVRKVPRQRRY